MRTCETGFVRSRKKDLLFVHIKTWHHDEAKIDSRSLEFQREYRKICHARNEISIRDLVNLGSRVGGGAVGKHVATKKSIHCVFRRELLLS